MQNFMELNMKNFWITKLHLGRVWGLETSVGQFGLKRFISLTNQAISTETTPQFLQNRTSRIII